MFFRSAAENCNISNLDICADNIQSNAYNVYKLLNSSGDQTSLNSFNETFHSGTNKLYSFNSGTPITGKYTIYQLSIVVGIIVGIVAHSKSLLKFQNIVL